MNERLKPSQETITPETRNQIRDLMRTSSWDTKETLLGAGGAEFAQVDRDLLEPKEATEVRKQTWISKLEERRGILSEANPQSTYEILMDNKGEAPTFELALFEKSTEGHAKRKCGLAQLLHLLNNQLHGMGKMRKFQFIQSVIPNGLHVKIRDMQKFLT